MRNLTLKLNQIFNKENREIYIGFLILLGVVYLEGAYATYLNQIYYKTYAPFFDSLSYLNYLARVMSDVQTEGILQAIQSLSSTVFLPFLGAAFLGIFFEPSRQVGIWLQAVWLFVLAISVFYYLYQFYFHRLDLSLALALPFTGIAAIWQYNGGLSDFRMDLYLYIFTGISFIWFLATRHTSKIYPWILFGIFTGLTFLSRATAPVYFVFALLPLVLVRLFQAKGAERLRLIKHLSVSIGLILLISLWFFITNFDNLYYYYFVWNLDANAKLPLSQSIQHLRTAIAHVGWFPFVLAAIVLPFTLRSFLKKNQVKDLVRQIDWEVLWIGLAPALFLVLRGAGLNPFVSMPAAFGIVLFILKPIAQTQFWDKSVQYISNKFILAISIFLFIAAALSGIPNHLNSSGVDLAQIAPIQQILDITLKDLQSTGKQQGKYAVPYVAQFTTDSIDNVYWFDYEEDGLSIADKRNRLMQSGLFGLAAPADWDRVPGTTDEEKITHLAQKANRDLDYLLVPSKRTLNFVEDNLSKSIRLNNYSRKIVERILETGKWSAIGRKIRINSNETVRVYRKDG